MIKAQRALAFTLALGAFASQAWAAELAGMVKNSKGQVSIERAGQRMPATVGAAVEVGDKLRTGKHSAVGVTLRDNTLLSAGANAVIVVDKFRYDTVTEAGEMTIGVRKGTLSVATGRIARKTPESVDFRTPTSVLGVRGTEFVIEVMDGNDE